MGPIHQWVSRTVLAPSRRLKDRQGTTRLHTNYTTDSPKPEIWQYGVADSGDRRRAEDLPRSLRAAVSQDEGDDLWARPWGSGTRPQSRGRPQGLAGCRRGALPNWVQVALPCPNTAPLAASAPAALTQRPGGRFPIALRPFVHMCANASTSVFQERRSYDCSRAGGEASALGAAAGRAGTPAGRRSRVYIRLATRTVGRPGESHSLRDNSPGDKMLDAYDQPQIDE